MSSFLVKIEKIKNILKQDGFFVGLKHIIKKVLPIVRMVLKYPKGEIVFVSGLTGAVAMYRTHYIAEELNEYGFKASVLYGEDPFLVSKIKKFKIIVLNRVVWNKSIEKVLEQSKKLKQTIIYDTDDLSFDVEMFKKSDAYTNFTEAQKKQYQKMTGLEILQDTQLNAITTTTNFLAEKLNRFNKPVFVVKNKLSKQELQWTREARKVYLRRVHSEEDVRIGYFSGSISHNRDFATIIPALEIILNRYSNVKLYLVGYLDMGDKFYKKFKNQIVQLPFVPRRRHYQNIAEVDINLAPLEMNDFCQSKSELKFFEAGIIGIPTIATENQTFSEAITNEKNGLLSREMSDWVNNIEKLIDDKNLRVTLGEKARQEVLKKYLTDSGDNGEYYEFLKENIK
jgi:glycosyltransferase involved in cell wall biosynthesis